MGLRTVLAFGGAAVGSFFGYPQLGYAIGSVVGSLVDPQKIQGPKIGEIPAQTSQEGGPIPIVMGVSVPMPGNIIASGQPVITKHKKSAKGGPKVVSETVSRTYAIGVCEGPITGFRRIWRNNELVYDATDSTFDEEQELILGLTMPSRNAAFLEKYTLYLGTFDQTPDPDLEAIFGVGTTPAHRGTVYMVAHDEDLTALGGAIPQWTFQVNGLPLVPVPDVGVIAWRQNTFTTYDGLGNALVSGGKFNEITTLFRAPRQENLDYALYYSVVTKASQIATRRVKVFKDGTVDISAETLRSFHTLGISDSDVLTPQGVMAPNYSHFLIFKMRQDSVSSDRWGIVWMDPETGIGNFTLMFQTSNFGAVSATAMRVTNGNVLYNRRVVDIDTGPPIDLRWRVTSYNIFANAGGTVVETDSGAAGPDGDPGEDSFVFLNPFAGGIEGAPELFLEDSNPFSTYIRDANPDSGIARNTTQYSVATADIYSGKIACRVDKDIAIPGGATFDTLYTTSGAGDDMDFTPTADRIIVQVRSPGSSAPPFRYVVVTYAGEILRDEVVAQPVTDDSWGNGSGSGAQSVTFPTREELSVGGGDIPPSGPAEQVAAICDRAGLPAEKIDVSDLADIENFGVTITNQYPAIDAIKAIAQAHFFDPVSIDAVVKFVRRGADAVATYTNDQMVDEGDSDDVEPDMRDDSITVPRAMHLTYFDILGGLTPNKQSSYRSGDRRAVGEITLQLPVILSADQAAQIVSINHKAAIEGQRGTVRIPLPDSELRLTAADHIIAPVSNVNRRLRIEREEVMDGFQIYQCAHDRQSIWTSAVQGIPTIPPVPPPSSFVGPTVFAGMDVGMLLDTDDVAGLGIYLAVGGLLPGWKGAVVEISRDGGATYPDSRTMLDSSIIGVLATALAKHPVDFPDQVNAVQISLPEGADLTPSTRAGVLNRANLAALGNPTDGYELINFRDAMEVSPGLWEISWLLRGRKGSTRRLHAAGDIFVLLDRSLIDLAVAYLADITKPLTFRVTSLGMTAASGTTSVIYNAAIQKERKPMIITVTLQATTLSIRWSGITRKSGGKTRAMSQHFTDFRVTVSDSTHAPIVQTTTASSIDVDVSGLDADLQVKVEAGNDITGYGPPAYWPTEPSPAAYLFLIGQESQFESGGILTNRLIFDDAAPPYFVNVDFHDAVGLDFSVSYYPPGATSVAQRTQNLATGEEMTGIARSTSDPEVLYFSDGFTVSMMRIRLYTGGGSPVLFTNTSLYAGLLYRDGELFAVKTQYPTSSIDALDENNLSLVRSLAAAGRQPYKFVDGRDFSAPNTLWVMDITGGAHDGQVFRIDKDTGTIDKTIDTRCFPLGGLVVGDFIYLYCKNNDSGHDAPAGFGIFKYEISTGLEVANFINADDTYGYIGHDALGVVVAAPYIAVGWGTGHKVFDTTIDAYISAP
jgi:hypothetical protein